MVAVLLCVILFISAAASATSTDAAANTMQILFSGSGTIATDAAGYQLFQAVSGPYFADGLDNILNQAYPLSSDHFAVPVAASLFSLE